MIASAVNIADGQRCKGLQATLAEVVVEAEAGKWEGRPGHEHHQRRFDKIADIASQGTTAPLMHKHELLQVVERFIREAAPVRNIGGGPLGCRSCGATSELAGLGPEDLAHGAGCLYMAACAAYRVVKR